jgi:rhodanese-related sulfurtransferase
MTIDHALDAARSHLRRVDAAETAELLAARDALVVDTRPIEQRQRDGEIPGALIIDRNVLEWRLDPASAHRVPEVTDYDQRIVVVCNEGVRVESRGSIVAANRIAQRDRPGRRLSSVARGRAADALTAQPAKRFVAASTASNVA